MGPITVLYLTAAGPQSEVLLLPAFAELAALLPQHQLDIHMIGPDVPEQLHGKACTAAATLHGEAALHSREGLGPHSASVSVQICLLTPVCRLQTTCCARVESLWSGQCVCAELWRTSSVCVACSCCLWLQVA